VDDGGRLRAGESARSRSSIGGAGEGRPSHPPSAPPEWIRDHPADGWVGAPITERDHGGAVSVPGPSRAVGPRFVAEPSLQRFSIEFRDPSEAAIFDDSHQLTAHVVAMHLDHPPSLHRLNLGVNVFGDRLAQVLGDTGFGRRGDNSVSVHHYCFPCIKSVSWIHGETSKTDRR